MEFWPMTQRATPAQSILRATVAPVSEPLPARPGVAGKTECCAHYEE
jgi:hypothetical protein